MISLNLIVSLIIEFDYWLNPSVTLSQYIPTGKMCSLLDTSLSLTSVRQQEGEITNRITKYSYILIVALSSNAGGKIDLEDN